MTDEIDKATIVAEICALLLEDNLSDAKSLSSQKLPFQPIPKKARKARSSNNQGVGNARAGGASRRVSSKTKLQVWQRDGFRCRYTGTRLVFPQTLELLSLILPQELPYDSPPHGKYELTHEIMWELWPAVDHLIPVSRSSDTVLANAIDNLVTASMPANQGKSSHDLSYLGWTLRKPEPLPNWDGLSTWFVQYLEKNKIWLDDPTFGKRFKDWLKMYSSQSLR